MKPKFLFFPLLFCLGLLALVSVSSCSKDDDSISESSLIGTWKLTHTKGYYFEDGTKNTYDESVSYIATISFCKDHTWSSYTKENGNDSGTWSLSGDEITVTDSDKSVDKCTIKISGGSTMEITFSDGDSYVDDFFAKM